ncbi:BTAD domain-containing putative transcriptional regulator [Streptomyces sp. NPDC001185]|uniref:AfsR/SARP family transcriptional regulator n=1 Tax=Streptomyces sp. NPDC001185 TaxID=3154380 RepID=UPI00332603AD
MSQEVSGETFPALRFVLLGRVRAWFENQELDLGSPQQRAVLATLLLRCGRPIAVSGLIDAVWGENPPPAAVSVLRTYVSRLRKVLEPGRSAGESPQVVVSAADGYLVRASQNALDLNIFNARVAEARKLRAAGAAAAAADLLRIALNQWEGAPLAGLPGPLAEAERSRLEEERINTLEMRLEIDVQIGRHGEVLAELISLTETHPLREKLCRLLMLALYRSGRQAEALEAYRKTRKTLVTEFGIEPSTPLRQLHDRILAADGSLGPELMTPENDPTETVAASLDSDPYSLTVTPTVRPAQLPADLTTFTGRHVEVEQMKALLLEEGAPSKTVVISAIHGMAAIGKTALAVHVAHQVADKFPGGQLFINLRGFDPVSPAVQPGEAIRDFLDALGIPPQRIPAGIDAQSALYRSLLANRNMLIVLDNARDIHQIRPLLPGSPGSLVIVTSRNELTGLVVGDGAHPLTLSPWTQEEAHDFLAKRLKAERLAAEPEAAEEIIRHSDRLPLALAVVAARAATNPNFPLSVIVDSLREHQGSLDAFAGSDIDIRAVFFSSYNSLSGPASHMFRLLGLHAGPYISAPAIAALAALPLREARSLLLELKGAHLLVESKPDQFTLHDLLRVYAAERAQTEMSLQEKNLAIERLLTWYLHTADAAYGHITPHRRRISIKEILPSCVPLTFTTYEQALEWCTAERANLVFAVRAAAASRQPAIAWQLTSLLWGFFYLSRHTEDWLDTTQTGLAVARFVGDLEGEAQSLMDLAAALHIAGRDDETFGHLNQALAIYRKLGDVNGRAAAVSNLGNAYLAFNQLGKAIEYLRRGLALFEKIGDSWALGINLSNVGDCYRRLGQFDDAISYLERALTALRTTGNRWVEGVTLDVLGMVKHQLHRHSDAITIYQQALVAHREVGNRWGEGHTLDHIGDTYFASGQQKNAKTCWGLASDVFEDLGRPEAKTLKKKMAELTYLPNCDHAQ